MKRGMIEREINYALEEERSYEKVNLKVVS